MNILVATEHGGLLHIETDLALPWEQLLTPDTSKQLEHSQVTLVKQKLWEKYLNSFKPVGKGVLQADSESGQPDLCFLWSQSLSFLGLH